MAESHRSSSSSAASSIGTGSRSSRRSHGLPISYSSQRRISEIFKEKKPFEEINHNDFKLANGVTLDLLKIGRKFRHILPPKSVIYWDSMTNPFKQNENETIGKYSNWLGTMPISFRTADNQKDWDKQQSMAKGITKKYDHKMPKRLLKKINKIEQNRSKIDHIPRVPKNSTLVDYRK